jgi:polyphosphate kinase
MESRVEIEPTVAVEPIDLDSTALYLNRELSWLQFNERVLELAEDERTPLLERVKFLAIYASNLDEFYMVRVAGLHDQVDAGIDARGHDGLSPAETIEQVTDSARELGRRHSRQWEQELRPALAQSGIRVVDVDHCMPSELEAVDRLFAEQIFPVLTPLAVGPGRPFPYISNLSLSIAVQLRDPVSETETFARVKVPREVVPRFLGIGRGAFVTLEAVIARHLDALFPGMEVLSHDFFRVTRDADFTVSDEADDLLRAVEDELRRRRFGEVVRLEVSSSMDPEMRSYLVDQLAIDEMQVIDVEGLLAADDLWDIYGVEGHRELRDEPWTPVPPPAFNPNPEESRADLPRAEERADMFAAMRAGDILVHHPYDSFAGSIERLVKQAVADPDVLAIKMTVYRTSDDSELVPALIEAAERGKQAVCLVELKARFDERRNIEWARALEEAGAHVVHGLPGLKTHAKALIIVRREGDEARHYVHIGTGNYHAKTARLYEDFGLFTTDREIGADVAELFNALTGAARSPNYRKAIVAPDHMRNWMLDQIEQTIAAHREGRDARIVMKMNSLVDARCIKALYEASQAGVRIDLNIRGICRLRAGVPGVSENIRVVSVVGRFLEHARVYGFRRGDERRWWMGSADLMPRNLDTRVELLAPVEDPRLQAEIEDTLKRCFADDTFAWELRPDDRWHRRTGNTRSVHRELMELTLERAAGDA